ncbi:uncharacterized protein LOC125555845 [Triticum urartu]|uniref:uncharacterized protein LOC125555845 n=1 Tax=Triticum urartu TaxID=4572 RepID=UPI002044B139|nr:uncharacterized protein LOC125555845 [Triticum urartu]
MASHAAPVVPHAPLLQRCARAPSSRHRHRNLQALEQDPPTLPTPAPLAIIRLAITVEPRALDLPGFTDPFHELRYTETDAAATQYNYGVDIPPSRLSFQASPPPLDQPDIAYSFSLLIALE